MSSPTTPVSSPTLRTSSPIAQASALTAREQTTVTLLERIVPLADRLRVDQAHDGSISEPTAEHVELVRRLGRLGGEALDQLGLPGQAEALRADTDGWLAAGLDTKPEFDRTRDAIVPPADGETGVFLGPALMTNAEQPVKYGFEAFAYRRREPAELDRLAALFPHPKNICQATQLLIGSAGAARGNCIVFFPENIAAREKPSAQAFAIFFFNKFRRIHETFAVPAARAALTEDSLPWASYGLDPRVCYEARAQWGYLHDYFHHQGPRPFDENIKVKLNWFVGLLEEIKVDCQTILACLESDLPMARPLIDMVLIERMFRYPLDPAAQRVFDSGTGVLLFSWLREQGAITAADGERLRLSLPATYPALRALVDAILEIETRVGSDDEYRAEALAFVRRYLPEGADGDRFTFTADQEILRRYATTAAQRAVLTFGVNEL